MPREHFESLRRLVEAFNVRDFEVIDLYTFRDGPIVRVDGFLDRAEAFKGAGLSE